MYVFIRRIEMAAAEKFINVQIDRVFDATLLKRDLNSKSGSRDSLNCLWVIHFFLFYPKFSMVITEKKFYKQMSQDVRRWFDRGLTGRKYIKIH